MKAIELRKGNLLLGSEDQVVIVECINRDGSVGIVGNASRFGVESDVPCLIPIPLTEEWLTKAGFITMDYEIDYIEWGIQTADDPNCECFHIIQDGTVEPFFFEYDLGYGDRRIEIKYVHQFQNLYFALTGGEELEFK